jgi:hypothetical protein
MNRAGFTGDSGVPAAVHHWVLAAVCGTRLSSLAAAVEPVTGLVTGRGGDRSGAVEGRERGRSREPADVTHDGQDGGSSNLGDAGDGAKRGAVRVECFGQPLVDRTDPGQLCGDALDRQMVAAPRGQRHQPVVDTAQRLLPLRDDLVASVHQQPEQHAVDLVCHRTRRIVWRRGPLA